MSSRYIPGIYNYLSDSTHVTVSGVNIKFSKKSTNISGEEKIRYVKISPSYFKLICLELDNLIICAEDSLHVERFSAQPKTASKLDGDVGSYYSLSVQEFGTRDPENYICIGFADADKQRIDGGINLKLDEAEILRDYSEKMTELLEEKLATKKRKLDDIYGLPGQQTKNASSEAGVNQFFRNKTGGGAAGTTTTATTKAQKGAEPVSKKRKWIDNFFTVFSSAFMITIFRYVLNPEDQRMNKKLEEEDSQMDSAIAAANADAVKISTPIAKENDEFSSDDGDSESVFLSEKRQPFLRKCSSWYLQEDQARISAKLNGINEPDFILEKELIHLSGMDELLFYVTRTVTLRLFWKIACRGCDTCEYQKASRQIHKDGHCKECDNNADSLYKIYGEATWRSLQAIEISDIVSEILAEMDLPCNRNLVWLACKAVLKNVVNRDRVFDIHGVYPLPDWYSDTIDSFLQIPLTSVKTDDEAALQFAKYI